jgi:hypothetical protein
MMPVGFEKILAAGIPSIEAFQPRLAVAAAQNALVQMI